MVASGLLQQAVRSEGRVQAKPRRDGRTKGKWKQESQSYLPKRPRVQRPQSISRLSKSLPRMRPKMPGRVAPRNKKSGPNHSGKEISLLTPAAIKFDLSKPRFLAGPLRFNHPVAELSTSPHGIPFKERYVNSSLRSVTFLSSLNEERPDVRV